MTEEDSHRIRSLLGIIIAIHIAVYVALIGIAVSFAIRLYQNWSEIGVYVMIAMALCIAIYGIGYLCSTRWDKLEPYVKKWTIIQHE